jgi:hypothetical protein
VDGVRIALFPTPLNEGGKEIQSGGKNRKKNPDRVDITGWTAKPLIFRLFWVSRGGSELSTIDKASTQRLKRSGMAWTIAGGQAILTLRSLIQSARWCSAWMLLSADFREDVNVRKQPNQPIMHVTNLGQIQPITLSGSPQPVKAAQYATLPLAG